MAQREDSGLPVGRQLDVLRDALDYVKQHHALYIGAMVVLPDNCTDLDITATSSGFICRNPVKHSWAD
ncbi:MAG: hypothetical protein H6936_03375 [Burkholderiales bacterium]|nr:hypothetical protein [Nitrosomonas sp.]MCP5273893.1 hypothetical protein [Burkholderiales bacterium]